MRLARSWLAPAATTLLLLSTGCTSGKVVDAYMSRDSEGFRRTECFRPEWDELFAIFELITFKDDSRVSVFISPDGDDAVPQGDVVTTYQQDEQSQYGNIIIGEYDGLFPVRLIPVWDPPPEDPNYDDALGHCAGITGDARLACREAVQSAVETCLGDAYPYLSCSPGVTPAPLFAPGKYRVDLFLNRDLIEANAVSDATLRFEVSTDCPCTPFADCPTYCASDRDCRGITVDVGDEETETRCFDNECRAITLEALYCEEKVDLCYAFMCSPAGGDRSNNFGCLLECPEGTGCRYDLVEAP